MKMLPHPENTSREGRPVGGGFHQRFVMQFTCLAAVVVSGTMVPAGEPRATPLTAPLPVDFAADVLPVLQRHCFECHGSRAQEGGLRFDDPAAAINGGDAGPVIAPGEPAGSELYRRIRLARSDDEAMPPRGPGLTAAEQAVIRRWIAEGAEWPDDFVAEKHWAYVPPVRQLAPLAAAHDKVLSDPVIDGWVAAAHDREGLSFAPPAERERLLRRVSFDLTGLPPSLEEQAAFLAEPDADAYERLVDRLLGSDEFGVRWARMWLDLARYADSHGYQRDDLRSLWAYRDWVVAALNADLPFDQFTIQQLAGDLLPEADESTRVATGFHRCAPTNVEAGTDPEESRINQVFDRVNTTGAVWLGTTLECAQCHDHKYDPFPQVDYYAMAAFFNSTETEVERANPKVPSSIRFVGPSMPLSVDPWAVDRDRLARLLDEAKADLEQLKAAAPPTDEPLAAADGGAGGEAAGEEPLRKEASQAAVKAARQRVEQLQNRLDDLPSAETLVMRQTTAPRETFLFNRGDFTDPIRPVAAGTPAVLGGSPGGPANRLTLARWLVARDNPLTARVLVNRIWFEIFGRGLVTTLEDFGIKGEPPSHPELLDSLAVDWMEDGWSLKRLIRRIVLSRTYRQSSQASAVRRSRDPDNRWLSRGPRFRLDAEAIRDNALAIAGLLSREKGGDSIRPPQPAGLWTKVGGKKYRYEVSPGERRYRRGLYVVLKRGSPYPSLVTFDATGRMTCVVKRSRSNTPLQALVLLNDPVYTEAAISFAHRIVTEQPKAGFAGRITHAFRIALARDPTAAELAVLRRLIETEQERLLAEPARAMEVLKAQPTIILAEDVSAVDVVAWYAVAAAILNLDETITKG
jgi:hypothetical protein